MISTTLIYTVGYIWGLPCRTHLSEIQIYSWVGVTNYRIGKPSIPPQHGNAEWTSWFLLRGKPAATPTGSWEALSLLGGKDIDYQSNQFAATIRSSCKGCLYPCLCNSNGSPLFTWAEGQFPGLSCRVRFICFSKGALKPASHVKSSKSLCYKEDSLKGFEWTHWLKVKRSNLSKLLI